MSALRRFLAVALMVHLIFAAFINWKLRGGLAAFADASHAALALLLGWLPDVELANKRKRKVK